MMEFLTWSVTIIGLLQAILIFFKKKENMYLQVMFSICFLIMSYNLKLYADIFESAILLILAFIGTYMWTKDDVVDITRSGKKEYIYSILIFIVSNSVLIYLLTKTDDPYPVMDSITTSLSLIGAYLMAMKKIEAWIVWFIYDVLSIVIYLSIGTWLINVVCLNVVWTLLAIGTYYSWKKDLVEM